MMVQNIKSVLWAVTYAEKNISKYKLIFFFENVGQA